MRDRILNAIALIGGSALIAVAFYLGCRAMEDDPRLWLFATVGTQMHSPRGAETFAATSISVTVQWTHTGKAQGYRFYLRRAGATYTGFTDAGTNKVIRISGLQRKTTYKCVVTSYVGTLESARSEELTFRTGNNSNAPVEEL